MRCNCCNYMCGVIRLKLLQLRGSWKVKGGEAIIHMRPSSWRICYLGRFVVAVVVAMTSKFTRNSSLSPVRVVVVGSNTGHIKINSRYLGGKYRTSNSQICKCKSSRSQSSLNFPSTSSDIEGTEKFSIKHELSSKHEDDLKSSN